MRILLIEDDDLMSRAVSMVLKNAGFTYSLVRTGEEGIDFAFLYDYDAIILDLALPDIGGGEVLRRLRLANIKTPVLVLSGDTRMSSKVDILEIGGDDYVEKPFKTRELTARLSALVRRSRGLAMPELTFGSLAIDLTKRTVSVAGRHVALTAKEYDILEVLALSKGVVVSKETFLTKIYGGRDEPESKIIDVFICKMRKKLAEAGDGAAGCIETVWGRGYALRSPDEPTMTIAA